MMIHVYFSLSLSYMTLLRRRGICTMCFRAEKATSSCGSEPKTYLPVPFILIFIPVLWINSETISCWFLWDLLWQTMKKSSNKWLKNRKHYCECVSLTLSPWLCISFVIQTIQWWYTLSSFAVSTLRRVLHFWLTILWIPNDHIFSLQEWSNPLKDDTECGLPSRHAGCEVKGWHDASQKSRPSFGCLISFFYKIKKRN
jgi:hypothetical protein